MPRTIEIVIDKKTGTVTMEGMDFNGKDCQLIEELAKQIGAVTSVKKKAEFYQGKVSIRNQEHTK